MSQGSALVRPARVEDLEGLLALARKAGLGMTNLPPCEERMAQLLAGAEAQAEAISPAGPQLLLVLEHEQRIVGTGCIFPQVGVDFPFHSYRISRLRQTSSVLSRSVESLLLSPVTEYDGCAEVGGLFVCPDHRSRGAGRLIARSRYMFLAEHRQAFGTRVIAELRGHQDERGRFPFWEFVAKPFYGLEFAEADRLSVGKSKQMISDLGPKYPIYLNLLPPEAAGAAGRCHAEGVRALALLEEEGFAFEGCIDIFDGGPTLVAKIDDLKAVRERRISPVLAIDSCDGAKVRLVSVGTGRAFRAACGPAITDEEGLTVSLDLAEALNLTVGTEVRHVGF